jgi:hypothetical protein
LSLLAAEAAVLAAFQVRGQEAVVLVGYYQLQYLFLRVLLTQLLLALVVLAQ